MNLLKTQSTPNETITQIEFEKIAHDCFMISIIFDTCDNFGVPSYWRLLGSKPNPPLEIGINTDKNTIIHITLFVDANSFREMSLEGIATQNGNIIIESNTFKKRNDYVDIEGEYFTTLSANNLMCVFGTQNRIKSAIGNDRFKFLLTRDDELCGFEICNLSKNEIKSIQSIQVPYSMG
jgi:hypothetical protein